MSNTLQDIKKDIDISKLTVRDWTSTLPVFNAELKNVQRRTARKFAIDYIEKQVNAKVSALVRKEEASDTSKVLAGMIGNVIIATGKVGNVRSDNGLSAKVMVIISPQGELAVTRGLSAHGGVRITPAEFHTCIEEIKRRVGVDSIDPDTPIPLLVQGYLVEAYRKISNTLPRFQ